MPQSIGQALQSIGGNSGGFGQLGGMTNQTFGNSYQDFGPLGTAGPGNIGEGMGTLGSQNQAVPLTPAFGGMATVGLGPTIDNLAWQLSRNEALATQQLTQYESGQLPTGTQQAIETAYQQGSNQLTQEYANMGRDPSADTSFGAGMQDLQQQKSVATQQALDQLLQQYYTTSQLELGISQTEGGLEVNQGELAIQQEQVAIQLMQMQMQQEQQQAGMMGSLMSGIGSLFGGI